MAVSARQRMHLHATQQSKNDTEPWVNISLPFEISIKFYFLTRKIVPYFAVPYFSLLDRFQPRDSINIYFSNGRSIRCAHILRDQKKKKKKIIVKSLILRKMCFIQREKCILRKVYHERKSLERKSAVFFFFFFASKLAFRFSCFFLLCCTIITYAQAICRNASPCLELQPRPKPMCINQQQKKRSQKFRSLKNPVDCVIVDDKSLSETRKFCSALKLLSILVANTIFMT